MFQHTAYLIETLTNTHVGSGDTTYGIADKVIQKDPVTRIPVFHPSSVKGAVKDHFEAYLDGNRQPANSDKVKEATFTAIFGGEEPAKTEDIKVPEKEKALLESAPRHGLMKFYEARLLTLPLRSSKRVYYNATSCHAVLDYLETVKQFGAFPGNGEEGQQSADKPIDGLIAFFRKIGEVLNAEKAPDFNVFTDDKTPPLIEEFEHGKCVSKEALNNLLGGADPEKLRTSTAKYLSPRGNGVDFMDTLAVFPDDAFGRICDENLPVIARNSLDEQGISQNLFYEEVLPRRSVLWFMTGTHALFADGDAECFQKMFKFFEDKLVTDNIQMGANASVGYGVTSIAKIGG
jgi:CRISPR-associated protein Cmr4